MLTRNPLRIALVVLLVAVLALFSSWRGAVSELHAANRVSASLAVEAVRAQDIATVTVSETVSLRSRLASSTAALARSNAALAHRLPAKAAVKVVAKHTTVPKVRRSAPKSAIATKRSNGATSGLWTVTGYCSCAKCCGKSNGITASGSRAGAGTVSAPSSFPFGTRLRIGTLGTFTVRDRGGSISGHHIDVWFPTHAAALRFGVKHLTVAAV